MGHPRLLVAVADDGVNVAVVAQGDGGAAHEGAVAGGEGGVLGLHPFGGLPPVDALLDQLQHATGVDAHVGRAGTEPGQQPHHEVVGIETAHLHQALGQGQGLGGIVGGGAGR